jgi:hypothetical protein
MEMRADVAFLEGQYALLHSVEFPLAKELSEQIKPEWIPINLKTTDELKLLSIAIAHKIRFEQFQLRFKSFNDSIPFDMMNVTDCDIVTQILAADPAWDNVEFTCDDALLVLKIFTSSFRYELALFKHSFAELLGTEADSSGEAYILMVNEAFYLLNETDFTLGPSSRLYSTAPVPLQKKINDEFLLSEKSATGLCRLVNAQFWVRFQSESCSAQSLYKLYPANSTQISDEPTVHSQAQLDLFCSNPEPADPFLVSSGREFLNAIKPLYDSTEKDCVVEILDELDEDYAENHDE